MCFIKPIPVGAYGGEEGEWQSVEELGQACPRENHGIIPARASPQRTLLSLKTDVLWPQNTLASSSSLYYELKRRDSIYLHCHLFSGCAIGAGAQWGLGLPCPWQAVLSLPKGPLSIFTDQSLLRDLKD